MREVIPLMVGTAGHVDHGKTTLLQRLAGGAPDADRLPEERARGLTIDIGYAELSLSDDRQVGVVDVPGHERFVRNMVAAASGIDLILLVVAADDGVMPQTREHLEIADLLGARAGLAAITKIDLVEEELALVAEEEVRDLLRGTFLEGAPVLRVSAATGEGIDELRAALTAELDRAAPRAPEGVFRMPVQRSFMRPGHGTVVTGVPLAGRVAIGDTLEVLPGRHKVRVRAIQAYHQEVEEGRAGHRTALKLSDVSWREVRRGDLVVAPGYLHETNLVEARLSHLARRAKPIVSNLAIRFHTGTSEVLGRVFLLEGRELAPGRDALVQFRLDRPVLIAPGDRFVVRAPSPQVTLGGGVVIGASETKISAGKTRLVRRVAERERGLGDRRAAVLFAARSAGLEHVTVAHLARELLRHPHEVEPVVEELVREGELERTGDRLLAASEAARGRERLVELLTRFHRKEPLRSAAGRAWARGQLEVAEAVLDALVLGEPRVESVEGGRLRRTGYEPALSPEQSERLEKLEEILERDDLATPRESELPALIGAGAAEAGKLLDLLIDRGTVVRIGSGVVYHRDALERVKEGIAAWIRANGPLAPADLKERFGMSRKYSIPLLEWLDSSRFTIRQGDRRILA